jgi:hypothetical protein
MIRTSFTADKKKDGLSPQKIIETCSQLSLYAGELHRRADEIHFQIDAAHRLLARFNAGQPDVMPQLATVASRLAELAEMAVTI